MSKQLRVGLAQIDSRLGEVATNLDKHLEWIEAARAQGVELLIFPELSLTGYRLLHLTTHLVSHARGIPGDATQETLAAVLSDVSHPLRLKWIVDIRAGLDRFGVGLDGPYRFGRGLQLGTHSVELGSNDEQVDSELGDEGCDGYDG